MGRIVILFMLITGWAQAQASHMTIRGVDYNFVGDDFMEYRTPGSYPSNTNNLMEYVVPFVRDAILNNQNLDIAVTQNRALSLTSTLLIEHNTATLFGDEVYGPVRDERVGATSYDSTYPGFYITVNSRYWNDFSEQDRRKLMYHELGHSLLHRDHVCESTVYYRYFPSIDDWYGIGVSGIMETGSCRVRYTVGCQREGYTGTNTCREGYDFRLWNDLLTHFYTNRAYLSRATVSSKGVYAIDD